MNISQPARNAALRIARKHLERFDVDVLTLIAGEVQQAIDFERAQANSYFILSDAEDFNKRFWDGAGWSSPQNKKVYNVFDEATIAYRKAFLSCPHKVVIAHATPTGIVKYQPL